MVESYEWRQHKLIFDEFEIRVLSTSVTLKPHQTETKV